MLLIDYRLAPEHPFPSVVQDTLAALRMAVRQRRSCGSHCDCGDSAGGALTLALLVQLR